MPVTEKIVTAAEMLAAENRWFESGEIDIDSLMDRVGKAIADWVLDDLGDLSSELHVLALAGKGNNGGDALVAARYLLNEGVNATVALVMPRDDTDPLISNFQSDGGSVIDLDGKAGPRNLSNLCAKTNLILDGVFGFSISRPIEVPISTLFDVVKSSGRKVVAIDMPSGANPDTGEFDPNGLPADVCLSVGMHKVGPAVRFGDAPFGDEMVALQVGMPPDLTRHIKREVNTLALARRLLPSRGRTGHKGNFGRSLLLAGSNTYVGAASLAARACVRTGVGLVTLATPTSAYQALAGSIPEATYVPLDEDANGVIPGIAFAALQERLPEMDSALIGVGIGLSDRTRELVSRLTYQREIWEDCTVVFDADGLTLVSQMPGWSEVFKGNLVITPHPGEMSRLLGISVQEVEANRLETAQMAAERFNCTTVLKGATTLIASPDGRLRVNMMPNDGLARGGTGDVLAGLITGLAARTDPFDAASLGVHIHSLSAKSARDELTPYAMTASDLVSRLPDAFRALAS